MSEARRCPVCGHVTERLAKHVFTYKANEPAHTAFAAEQRRTAVELFHKEVPVGKNTDLTEHGLIIGRQLLMKIWVEEFGEAEVRRRANWSRGVSNARAMVGNHNRAGIPTPKTRCPVCGKMVVGLWAHLCRVTDEEHVQVREQQRALMHRLFNDDTFTEATAEEHGLLVGHRVCMEMWKRWFTDEQREVRSRRMISAGRRRDVVKKDDAAPVEEEPGYRTDVCPVCGGRYASLWTHLLQHVDDPHRLVLADLTKRINELFNDLTLSKGADPHDWGLPVVYAVCVDVWRANFGDAMVRTREQLVGRQKISEKLKGRVFTDEHREQLTNAQRRLQIDVTKYLPRDGGQR